MTLTKRNYLKWGDDSLKPYFNSNIVLLNSKNRYHSLRIVTTVSLSLIPMRK
jgi:hypothetical protein